MKTQNFKIIVVLNYFDWTEMNRSLCIKCKKHMHKYLLLSASRGSVPGKVIVIVDGELTSYFLWGFLHTFIFTKAKNTVFARIETKGWSWLGKKLEKKQCVVYRALDMTTMYVYITCTYVHMYIILYYLIFWMVIIYDLIYICTFFKDL